MQNPIHLQLDFECFKFVNASLELQMWSAITNHSTAAPHKHTHIRTESN